MTSRTLLRIPDSRLRTLTPYLCLALLVGLWAVAALRSTPPAFAMGRGVAGRILDSQGEPIVDAELALFVDDNPQPVAHARSQPDGAYLLVLQLEHQPGRVRIEVSRPHFDLYTWVPGPSDLAVLLEQGSFVTHDIVLQRRVNASFWVVTLVFLAMLAVVATERLHNTLAALLAMVIIFGVSLLGETVYPDLFVFRFERALEHVEFEVIFLLLGMMIVIGVIEETGIFQWMAFQAYRLSRGKVWLLALVLMAITAAASALLDNVTTMLMITPIILEVALAMGLNPLSLVLPALLAANTGGLATLIGTPVNIMVGSYVGLGFNDFVSNLTPGVLLALAGLTVFVQLRYWKEYHAPPREPAADLLARLKENGQIRDPDKLRKSGLVFGVLLLLFVFGDALHAPPAVLAMAAAVAMLVWVNPNIRAMLSVVDWTTLVFFIALYIVVGAVQEVGLLSLVAEGLRHAVGDRLLVALLAVIWLAAVFSGLVDNIPFAAAMLPVIRFMTRSIAGAESNALFYGLALGADLGGNATLIASSANLVVAGITERAGYRLTFRKFLALGLPATAITTALGCVWLLLRFT
jgi:Na+/H+ antiporter NhaD/arsenite permease-like protein